MSKSSLPEIVSVQGPAIKIKKAEAVSEVKNGKAPGPNKHSRTNT